MLLARFHFVQGSELPICLQVGALQCHLSQDVNSGMLNILEFDFFDDEQLVVIYQSQSADCKHCGVRCLCCQLNTHSLCIYHYYQLCRRRVSGTGGCEVRKWFPRRFDELDLGSLEKRRGLSQQVYS